MHHAGMTSHAGESYEPLNWEGRGAQTRCLNILICRESRAALRRMAAEWSVG